MGICVSTRPVPVLQSGAVMPRKGEKRPRLEDIKCRHKNTVPRRNAPKASTIIEQDQNIFVAVRVRPMNAAEAASGDSVCVETKGATIKVMGRSRDGFSRAYCDNDQSFTFDAVLPASTSQQDTYEVGPIVVVAHLSVCCPTMK